MQVGTQSGDLGRMAALDAGYDITASGVTLDRFCGSGITTANMAVASVMAGMDDVVIAGGTAITSSSKENAPKARLPPMARGTHTLRALHPHPTQAVAAAPTPTPASPPTPGPQAPPRDPTPAP